MQHHQQARAAAIAPVGDGPNDGDLMPSAASSLQDGSLPSGRPGATHRGALGEAGFIEKDYGVMGTEVFFRRGQVAFFQRLIAASLRSLARVAGFCSDQPI